MRLQKKKARSTFSLPSQQQGTCDIMVLILVTQLLTHDVNVTWNCVTKGTNDNKTYKSPVTDSLSRALIQKAGYSFTASERNCPRILIKVAGKPLLPYCSHLVVWCVSVGSVQWFMWSSDPEKKWETLMEGHPPEYNFLIWSSDVTANTFYCLLLCGQLFNKPRLNDKKLFYRLQSNTPHNKKMSQH